MKKYSITFGNGIYFDCFVGGGSQAVQVGTFIVAWVSCSLDDIKQTMDVIKQRLPDAQLSIVTHEPVEYKPE